MSELKQVGAFKLLPPRPDVCQTCATKHEPAQAHNAQSLYYQYAFFSEKGRWPTWADAIAHCTPEIQAFWKAELTKRNAWTEPEEKQKGNSNV